MFEWANIFAGLAGAGLTALLGYYGIARKAKADETGIALNAWKELLVPLQEELRGAKEGLKAAEIEIKLLREALEKAEQTHREETAKLVNRIRKLQEELNRHTTQEKK